MSELSIPALSTNGAEQDFSTFTYGVWITNLSNSHVDIKEDNINTTSIHRLQNLNVLLMWLPFSSRIHQVSFISSPVRRRLSGTWRTSALVSKKRAIRRVQSIALVKHPEPRDRCLCVLYVLPSLSVSEMFWPTIALRYQNFHLDTHYILWYWQGGKYKIKRINSWAVQNLKI